MSPPRAVHRPPPWSLRHTTGSGQRGSPSGCVSKLAKIRPRGLMIFEMSGGAAHMKKSRKSWTKSGPVSDRRGGGAMVIPTAIWRWPTTCLPLHSACVRSCMYLAASHISEENTSTVLLQCLWHHIGIYAFCSGTLAPPLDLNSSGLHPTNRTDMKGLEAIGPSHARHP